MMLLEEKRVDGGGEGWRGKRRERTDSVCGKRPNDILQITVAFREGSILHSGWHVGFATDEIESVLTVIGGGDVVETSLETELAASDESIKEKVQAIEQRPLSKRCIRVPIENLLGCLARRIERRGEDDTAERVALQVGTMRVEFSSTVSGVKTEGGVVDETGNLDVGGGLYPLC
jgi:hypothetical protein